MKKIKSTLMELWKDESGQGTAEYVLILVAIVALAAVFRTEITEMMKNKMGDVAGEITNFAN